MTTYEIPPLKWDQALQNVHPERYIAVTVQGIVVIEWMPFEGGGGCYETTYKNVPYRYGFILHETLKEAMNAVWLEHERILFQHLKPTSPQQEQSK